jgi:hypothetical protein
MLFIAAVMCVGEAAALVRSMNGLPTAQTFIISS